MKSALAAAALFSSAFICAHATAKPATSNLTPYDRFTCELTANFGEMDGPLKKKFQPISKTERYMQVVQHLDLKVSAIYDEAGHSYTLEATGANDFHVKATLPYLPDAELVFSYELHDSQGQAIAFTDFVARCTK